MYTVFVRIIMRKSAMLSNDIESFMSSNYGKYETANDYLYYVEFT